MKIIDLEDTGEGGRFEAPPHFGAYARLGVDQISGTGTGWAVKLQGSLDGHFFHDLGTLSADGITSAIDVRGIRFLRAQVTTAANAAATARVSVTTYSER